MPRPYGSRDVRVGNGKPGFRMWSGVDVPPFDPASLI